MGVLEKVGTGQSRQVLRKGMGSSVLIRKQEHVWVI